MTPDEYLRYIDVMRKDLGAQGEIQGEVWPAGTKPPSEKLDPVLGKGGAPTRETTLPDDPVTRKRFQIASGFLDYFPDAAVAISEVSWAGNEQHNPGMPLQWTRGKSADEADALMRHFLRRGTRDKDGIRHSAKLAWRALALLQKEIEGEWKQG